MTRCIVVLGAAGTGKSTLVDKLCGLEGGSAQAATATETRTACLPWRRPPCPRILTLAAH